MLYAADPFLKILKTDLCNSGDVFVNSAAVGDKNSFDRRKIPLSFCCCICYNTDDVEDSIGYRH